MSGDWRPPTVPEIDRALARQARDLFDMSVALAQAKTEQARLRGALETVAQWDEWAAEWLRKNPAA